jgi:hypothetical protein
VAGQSGTGPVEMNEGENTIPTAASAKRRPSSSSTRRYGDLVSVFFASSAEVTCASAKRIDLPLSRSTTVIGAWLLFGSSIT